jgi:RNA-directed DNA polymerase
LNTFLANFTKKSVKKISVKKDFRSTVAAGFVRYADDFIVISNNLDNLNYLKGCIESFLEERGLELNVEKTAIIK